MRLTRAGGSVARAQTSTAAHDAALPASEAEAAAADPVERGKGLVAEHGCIACHTTDSKRTVGPGWGGLFGSEVTLADGGSRVADRDYLVESILEPDADIVEGYPPGLMPTYEGLLDQDEVDAMVEYLVSLGAQEE